MKYGLGSKDPEELNFYNKIREEMDDMKKDTVKKAVSYTHLTLPTKA